MATVLGNVMGISLETDVAKNGGGTYKGWELVYRTPQGEVRTIAKPIQGLRFNNALKTQLEALQVGDDFTLVQEKNANGFNEVKSVTKGLQDVVQAPTVTASAAGNGKGSSYTPRTNTYETPEERKTRQRLIVRQSSLTNSLSLLTTGAKTPPSVSDVLELAESLVSWVYEDSIETMSDDIPD